MNDKNSFIAQHQAGLSYLVLGSYFGLKILQAFGFGDELEADDLKEIAMVVVLFWFMRERGTKSDDTTIPPGGTSKTTTENVTTAPAVVETVTTTPNGTKVSKTKPKRAGV